MIVEWRKASTIQPDLLDFILYPASSNPSGRDRGPLAGPCLVIRKIVLFRSGAAGGAIGNDTTRRGETRLRAE